MNNSDYTPEQQALIDALARVTEISDLRSRKWHKDGELDWSVLEYAGAMCGEAGEAANVAKKILRQESGMKNGISTGLTTDQLDDMLGMEIADTFLYLVLLAKKRNISMGEFIILCFNRKSQEYGFPERL